YEEFYGQALSRQISAKLNKFLSFCCQKPARIPPRGPARGRKIRISTRAGKATSPIHLRPTLFTH
ncbi:MAG: hypothetical protein KC800_34055, partial [Candidatus Eremiobacteraeota bacterium]|nr:hypothetical protein [Candidatus Eremiobacteraeota bacterium]